MKPSLTIFARDSEYYAQAVITELLSISRSVGEYPMIGRMVPEIGDENIRVRFVYSYRLVYRPESARILIVAVIHGKRLLENVTDRFEDSA